VAHSGRDLRRLRRRAPFSTEALLRIMGGPFTRNSERWLKGALEMGNLSLWVLCEGNLKGGLLLGILKVTYKKALVTGIFP